MITGSLDPNFKYSEDPLERIAQIEGLVFLATPHGEKISRSYLEYDSWTIDEAVALLMGFAPPRSSSLLDIASKYEDLHHCMANALTLGTMIHRAHDQGRLRSQSTPSEYLEWLMSKRFPNAEPWKPPTGFAAYAPLLAATGALQTQILCLKEQIDSFKLKADEQIESERALWEANLSALRRDNEMELSELRAIKEYYLDDKNYLRYGKPGLLKRCIFSLTALVVRLHYKGAISHVADITDIASWPKDWEIEVWKLLPSTGMQHGERKTFVDWVRYGSEFKHYKDGTKVD